MTYRQADPFCHKAATGQPFFLEHTSMPKPSSTSRSTGFTLVELLVVIAIIGILAAIAGILGVGMGWWWADALAGALIAVDVTFDGLKMLREAVGDLMDRRPRFTAKARPSPLGGELESLLGRMPGVAAAQVRLREEGHVVGGEAFVVPSSDDNLTGNIAAAARQLNAYDWRIHEIVIMPVPDLEQSFAPRP